MDGPWTSVAGTAAGTTSAAAAGGVAAGTASSAVVSGVTVTSGGLTSFLNFFGAAQLMIGGVAITPELAVTSLAVGAVASDVASDLAEKLVKERPKMFMRKKRHIFPGTKYFEITGGPSAVPEESGKDLQISEISQEQYNTYNVLTVRHCIEQASRDKMEEVAFVMEECGDGRAKGKWIQKKKDWHSGRPRYRKMDDNNFVIEWSRSRKVWRMFYDDTTFGHGRESLYESKENTGSVPEEGWELCDDCIGGLPLPEINVMESSEEEHLLEHDGLA